MTCPYFLLLLISFICFGPAKGQDKSISFATELERIYTITSLPQYLNETVVKQISSYDTTGGNNDGFSGRYSYVRKEPSGGLVLFDQKGPGVIERIWTPTPTDDTLDFYFDGSPQPGFSIKFRDLFNNTVYPFLKPLADHKVGGFYSYIPIPYKKSCTIVFRGDKILFHQIQYREYGKGTSIQTFNKNDIEEGKTRLAELLTQWSNTDRDIRNFYTKNIVLKKKLTIQPGSSNVLAQLNQGGSIQGIELKPSDAFSGVYKQIDLKITWDNEKTPAVYVPVADFFGFAFGSRSMESLLLGTTAAKAYCYIPMPFDKTAMIELIYRTGAGDEKPIDISATVYYANKKRNAAREGKFYAFWKNEVPDLGKPYVFLNGHGKGHYIGTLLQGQATEFTNFTEFFEGDDYTEVDGKMTMHGTGSEDYFNGGWYAQPGGWVERLGAPLSGCLDYSLPLSRTGGYRFFISDKMAFTKSILHTMEHGPENNNRKVNYISVAMYYAEKPVEPIVTPVNMLTKVFIPDTLTFYTRLMQHLSYNGNMYLKDGQALLSGNDIAAMNINVNEVAKGKYKLYLHKIKGNATAIEVRIAAGRQPTDWKAVSIIANEMYLGDIEIYDTSIPVNVLFKGPEINSSLSFDRVMLVKN